MGPKCYLKRVKLKKKKEKKTHSVHTTSPQCICYKEKESLLMILWKRICTRWLPAYPQGDCRNLLWTPLKDVMLEEKSYE
jgi:hypothetical protein